MVKFIELRLQKRDKAGRAVKGLADGRDFQRVVLRLDLVRHISSSEGREACLLYEGKEGEVEYLFIEDDYEDVLSLINMASNGTIGAVYRF